MSFTKIFKTCCRIFLLLLVGLVLYFNAAFYYSPDFETGNGGTWNKDVYQQLSHLKAKMHTGAAVEMQQLFPEGHLFMNALYGLTCAEALTPLQISGATHLAVEHKLVLQEIENALVEMNSDRGRRIFNKDLPLPHGIFYRGWTNYLTGKMLEIGQNYPDSSDVNLVNFQHNCVKIAQAFGQSEGPYLQSYHNGTWPADNVLAIASLATYDRHFDTLRFRPVIESWLTKVKTQLDPTTGLIPHVVYENAPSQGARGSSQSLILSLLPEIDSTFAAEQFVLYEKYFVTSRLGLPAIREYPKETVGEGDVDSGPVIWDIGGAASIVGQRAALVNGNKELYVGLRNSIEAFGFAYTWFGDKKYVGGQLPMADAFIAWSNAAEKEPVNAPYPKPWLIHLISIAILSTLIWVAYRI